MDGFCNEKKTNAMFAHTNKNEVREWRACAMDMNLIKGSRI